MHCVTLKMDRVFDIRPYPIGHQKRTCFSFESGGKRYLFHEGEVIGVASDGTDIFWKADQGLAVACTA